MDPIHRLDALPGRISAGSAGPVSAGVAEAARSAGTVARLRQLIAEGCYAAGERLAEEAVAAALGVSRTPVRLAMRTLAQEGLLQSAGKRGHVVREFSAADVRAAVEVRGVLEGLAARRLAEEGLSAPIRELLHACLEEGEAVVARRRLGEDAIERWSAMNARFHAAIVRGHGGTRVIADALARNDHLPFASAGSITVDKRHPAGELRKLQMAQMQHRLVVQALEQRESARVESLMREHANIGLRYGALFGLEEAAGGSAPPLVSPAAQASPGAARAAPPAPAPRAPRRR